MCLARNLWNLVICFTILYFIGVHLLILLDQAISRVVLLLIIESILDELSYSSCILDMLLKLAHSSSHRCILFWIAHTILKVMVGPYNRLTDLYFWNNLRRWTYHCFRLNLPEGRVVKEVDWRVVSTISKLLWDKVLVKDWFYSILKILIAFFEFRF